MTWVAADLVGATEMNREVRDQFKAVAPVGKLDFFVRNPTAVETLIEGGWLECNGVAVSRTTYADLDALLAALTPARPFGVGDGSTTVNLPNLAGRVPVHVDNAARTGGKADALGEAGGEHAHALILAELAAHSHNDGTLAAASAGAHTHTLASGNSPAGVLYGSGPQAPNEVGGAANANRITATDSAGAHTHDVTGSTESVGSGGAHENMQPFLSCGVWAIKAKV